MTIERLGCSIGLVSFFLVSACNADVKNSGSFRNKGGAEAESKAPPQTAPTTKPGGSTGAGTGTSASPASVGARGASYFTGIDGKNDYSILLPPFESVTLADPTIANIEQIDIILSQETITGLLGQALAKYPGLDPAPFLQMMSSKPKVFKVTPLKAGKTSMKTVSLPLPVQLGGNGQKVTVEHDLVITAFTDEQYTAGRVRYETDGDGTLRSCKSCHETGGGGAPPHELGKIMEYSDQIALQWLKTGIIPGRIAKLDHKWGFRSDLEETGIVAFMRAKQTNDVETLIRMMVESFLAKGLPGPGTSGGTGTGTSKSP